MAQSFGINPEKFHTATIRLQRPLTRDRLANTPHRDASDKCPKHKMNSRYSTVDPKGMVLKMHPVVQLHRANPALDLVTVPEI